MIERQSFGGRDASVAYLDSNFQPADKSAYRYAKILFDDGDMQFLTLPPDDGQAEADAWNRHRTGQMPKYQNRARVFGRTYSQWAKFFAQTDAARIDTAIRTWLIGGLDSPDIARKVIGSAELNGIDGVTEMTRKQLAHLGFAAIKPPIRRKSPK